MTSANDSKNKNTIRIVTLIIVLLLAIYLIGAAIFTNIALPNTFLNGRDISYASKASALENVPNDFHLNIKGRDDRSLQIKPEDIDYKIELPKNAKLDQNPFYWPMSYIIGRKEVFDFEIKSFYNSEKLDKIIKDSSLMNGITEPENAKLEIKDKTYEIKKEVEGNKIYKDKLEKAIIDGINTGKKDITLEDSFYYAPKIRSNSKEIKDILADIEKLVNMTIKFNFNGFDLKLAGNSLIDVMDFTDNGYELNYDKVLEYVKYLADQTNTYGKNRTFNATGIGQITVGPGVYGFKLNIEAMIDKIYQQVNKRESGEIEPVYSKAGLTRTSTGGDIGDTYIEVDLSRQYLWFYKNGQVILESNIVSGIPRGNWATNKGVGAILEKNYKVTLKGVNFDRESKYETPVSYWMPIGWDGEGFHDAPWRGAFGGNIYTYSGSHGCLNLPPSVAKFIFQNADFMTPVVVYESSTNYSPAMLY